MAITYHYLLGRLCYTGSIFEPYIPPGEGEDKAKFGVTLLMNKQDATSDHAFVAYKADILAQGTAKFGSGAVAGGRPTFEVPALRDGDSEESDFMAGYWVVKTQSKWAPKVFAPDNEMIQGGSPEAEKLIYDGQNILVKVRLHAWTYMRRSGVSCGLQGIKILGGGVPEDYGGGGRVGDDLATNTPADLPPSMKAAADAARQAGQEALAAAPAPAGAPEPGAPAAKEDIPW